jgi:hypothetical protein
LKYILVFIFILFLWGCRKESVTQVVQKSAPVGESFDLKAGEAIVITGTSMSFRFDSVLYDSRCPEGAVCIWAGIAAIVISFPDEKDTLSTFYRRGVSKGDYSITFRTLSPYPKIGQQIPKNSYVAQFSVSKN